MKTAQDWADQMEKELGEGTPSAADYRTFIDRIQKDAIEGAYYEVAVRYPMDNVLLGVFAKFLGKQERLGPELDAIWNENAFRFYET